MKKIISPVICLFALILLSNQSFAQANIKVYFTQPVDNSVSKFPSGVQAIGLSGYGYAADTIADYIDRAKSTLDLAIYDFTSTDATNVMITAINNAASRGVKVRLVYDGSEKSISTALPMLSSSVTQVEHPSGSYIMHDKYIIIDAASSDAVVFTTSADWSSPMLEGGESYNNLVFLQSQGLAGAYEQDFNQMFAGTFGTSKTPVSGTFTVGGSTVDVYFSSEDNNAEAEILGAMNSANTDLYVGMYTFTETDYSNAMCTLKSKGIAVYAVLDQYSSSMVSTLSSCLGSSNVAEYTGSYIYHNKYSIIDPSDPCSDPQVETGSENWTESAYNGNDENIIIIHNDTVADLFYQSFYEDFKTLGSAAPATIPVPGGCKFDTTASTTKGSLVPQIGMVEKTATVYPNPTNGDVAINYSLSAAANSNVEIYNIVGQKIATLVNNTMQQAGSHNYSYTLNEPGIYFVQFTIGQERFTKKLIVTE